MRLSKELIIQAVKSENGSDCVEIADECRRRGMNYPAIWRLVNNVTGIDPATWDELLREGESG